MIEQMKRQIQVSLLILTIGIFQSNLVLGETALPGPPCRTNTSSTIPLKVSLPPPQRNWFHGKQSAPTSSTSGLLWQDLSVATSDKEYLLHPSSGYVENGSVCGILGPCKYR